MNIKSLLLGSAAALAAVSGAQAADAIVAAEPEPMEYVRVCDAFGTGFFYIPGTETCLKIGGYVRFQVDANDNLGFNLGTAVNDVATRRSLSDDAWNARTRGYISLDARTDTELGTLGSFIAVRTWAEGDYAGGSLEIDEAYLTLGGFKAGYGYNYFDKYGLSGETDDLGSNRINMIGYEYKGDGFSAGLFIDELTGMYSSSNIFSIADGNGGVDYTQNDRLGVEGMVTGTFGAITAVAVGGYDFAAENGTIKGILTANLGPGALSVAGIWSSGPNAYYDLSEWAVAAQYAAKFGKWTFTPGFQYWGNLGYTSTTQAGVTTIVNDWVSNDAWRAGLTVDYTIVSGSPRRQAFSTPKLPAPRALTSMTRLGPASSVCSVRSNLSNEREKPGHVPGFFCLRSF